MFRHQINLSVEAPIAKQSVEVSFKPAIATEGQVTVHCRYLAQFSGDRIRIWPSTYLKYKTHKSNLVHVENISIYPQWTLVQAGKSFRFSLIFSALPKGCSSFDLVEEIPEPGGFLYKNIKRNNADVYQIEI